MFIDVYTTLNLGFAFFHVNWILVSPEACTTNFTCGYNSNCVSNVCTCNFGFYSLINGKDCIDGRCGNGQCYTCIDNIKCQRCKNIVVDGTGKCVNSCKTQTSLKFSGEFQGKVCAAPKKNYFTRTEYIALIAGFCAAALMLIVIGIVCYKIRKKRRDAAADAELPASLSSKEVPLKHRTPKLEAGAGGAQQKRSVRGLGGSWLSKKTKQRKQLPDLVNKNGGGEDHVM